MLDSFDQIRMLNSEMCQVLKGKCLVRNGIECNKKPWTAFRRRSGTLLGSHGSKWLTLRCHSLLKSLFTSNSQCYAPSSTELKLVLDMEICTELLISVTVKNLKIELRYESGPWFSSAIRLQKDNFWQPQNCCEISIIWSRKTAMSRYWKQQYMLGKWSTTTPGLLLRKWCGLDCKGSAQSLFGMAEHPNRNKWIVFFIRISLCCCYRECRGK